MHHIEYRDARRTPWMPWALHAGTRPQAIASALRLLESMRDDEGLDLAAVRVDGRAIRRPK